MPSIINSLVFIIKQKTNYRFHVVAMLFYILQKITSTKLKYFSKNY